MPPNFEVVQNRAKFCMFLTTKIFGGKLLEFLDRRYKTRPGTDHRAKYRADRPTHLGDLAFNQKIVAKHKQP